MMMQTGDAKVQDMVLNDIYGIMDDIYEECQSQYTLLNRTVVNRRDAVAACATQRDTEWSGTRGIMDQFSALESMANEYKTCMDDLCAAEDIRISTCDARDHVANQTHAAIPNCSAVADTCGPSVDSCEACTVKANQWYNDWFTQLDTLITDCETETLNVSNRNSTCKAKESPYELAWCSYDIALTDVCRSYSQCYNVTTAAYISDTMNLTNLTATNINTCYAIKKVKCWVGVIETCQGSTDKSSCDAAKANCDITDDPSMLGPCVQALNVSETSPPYVDQEACDRYTLRSGTPGSGTWSAEWYHSDNDFHDAICQNPKFAPAVATVCPTIPAW